MKSKTLQISHHLEMTPLETFMFDGKNYSMEGIHGELN
jgi:hypothetical protein